MPTEISNTDTRIDGQVAIVTGASRGIGASIAHALAAAGAKVVVASRRIEGLTEVARSIEARGGVALPYACHMGEPEQIDTLVAAAVEAYGQVDILINNAATNPYFGTMLDIEWSAWDKTFDVNLKGYFAMTRAVTRHLIDRGAEGSIVNIASIAGLMAAPMQGVYAMSKAAVVSMTKTLASELGSYGVRVNAIAPGLVETKFARALIDTDMIREPLLARTPLGRVGQPEDIAQAALFLASGASRFLTGQVMVIDGGMTIG